MFKHAARSKLWLIYARALRLDGQEQVADEAYANAVTVASEWLGAQHAYPKSLAAEAAVQSH